MSEGEKSQGHHGERRPVDHVDEAVGIAGEAAELAEHIRDTDPQYRRDELLDHLIEMIDDAHEKALEASVRWHNGGDEPRIRCPLCNETSETVEEYSRHMAEGVHDA